MIDQIDTQNDRAGTLSTESSANFLITEYKYIFDEIRKLNDFYSTFIKYFVTLYIGFFVYFIFGQSPIVNLHASVIGKAYNCVGLLYALLIILLSQFYIRQFAASKKHKIRYWKTLHVIRCYFLKTIAYNKENYPLPQGTTDRPRITMGEYVGPLLFMVVCSIPATMGPFMLYSMIKNRFIVDAKIISLLISLPIIWVFLFMYLKEFFRFGIEYANAEIISLSNVYYPDFGKTYKGLFSKFDKIKEMIVGISLLIYFILCYSIAYFLATKTIESSKALKRSFYIFTIFLLAIIICNAHRHLRKLVEARRVYFLEHRLKDEITIGRNNSAIQSTFLWGMFVIILVNALFIAIFLLY